MFELNQYYEFVGDTGAFPHVVDSNGNTVYIEDDEFYLHYNGNTVRYMRGLITVKEGTKLFCCELNPLTFVVDSIFSPVLTYDVVSKNFDTIKRTFDSDGKWCTEICQTILYNACIPSNLRDFAVDEQTIRDTFIKWLDNSILEYEGSVMGYGNHKDSRQLVYRVLYGEEIARCLGIMIDHNYTIDFDKNNWPPIPIYQGKHISNFIQELKGIVGMHTSNADALVQEILKGADKPKHLSNDERIGADFTALIFLRWYDELDERRIGILRAVSPDLEEAARTKNEERLRSYGSRGLRQSMSLIFGAMQFSGHISVFDFYKWMYTSVKDEGWSELYNMRDVYETFKCLCNCTSELYIADASQDTVINIIKSRLKKYEDKSLNYEYKL